MKPAPKPQRESRAALEKRLEAVIRELEAWRDPECIFKQMDGGRCRGGLQWSHFISQHRSKWLQLDIGNSGFGCAGHNHLDHIHDPYISVWYSSKFGAEAWRMLNNLAEQMRQYGKAPGKVELEERLVRYRRLLDERPSVYNDALLVAKGYFGAIPQSVSGDRTLNDASGVMSLTITKHGSPGPLSLSLDTEAK